MSNIGHSERVTQNRVITLFKDQLGYDYLGNWQDRPKTTGQPNSNIEAIDLTRHLTAQGYSPAQISQALYQLRTEADKPTRSLYDNNKAVYSLLYYGIQIKTSASEPTETLQLINWQNPEQNHFAIAEEVTLQGQKEKRPDLVLYLNGIAIALIELKNSREDIGKGIRQSLTNQQPEFIGAFFSTIQLIFAGNDSEGLRYGTIGTPEKYFLTWKEDETENSTYKLDKYLLKLCEPHRLLDLIQNFILFDAGVKKLSRCHQYFGVKAAQKHIRNHEGGIIWHTTQSGKLHRTMKALMPKATFIGFTGTPLLKKDAQTSLEVFGKYIHTYKFSEAVEDNIVLDLIYEARDIDQTLGSETKIDAWFDAKTQGLNDWQKATLREKWGTLQTVLSLDGEDKDFGYIVDYKDLFKKVENAIAVYTAHYLHGSIYACLAVLPRNSRSTAYMT